MTTEAAIIALLILWVACLWMAPNPEDEDDD